MRGRKPKAIKSVPWKVYIPEDLAAKMDLIMMDPVTQQCRYGERSDLVARLLRLHIMGLQKTTVENVLTSSPEPGTMSHSVENSTAYDKEPTL